ncbi:MAG: biotin--[acetyl-CoA-carboxylase] ligase [Chloroflexi bacterium]|nr:MAG: biotin--[acetyl-CoA-carboxylase] ligase [Chloroflexota bacterium]
MWLNLAKVEEHLATRFVGRRVVYLTSTTSTMDVARQGAEAGAPDGTVVFAEEQTKGRGRFDRAWVSPSGKNLYLTLVIRPPLGRLSTGLRPRIKWPNDVLIDGRKLSGVLIESEISGSAVQYALVGPGINVNFDIEQSPEIAAIATSIKRELGREASREELLAAFLNHFEALYEDAPKGDAAFQEWRSRLDTLGREVCVTFGDQLYEGTAEDVDRDGNLILVQADGSRRIVEAGEVTLRA